MTVGQRSPGPRPPCPGAPDTPESSCCRASESPIGTYGIGRQAIDRAERGLPVRNCGQREFGPCDPALIIGKGTRRIDRVELDRNRDPVLPGILRERRRVHAVSGVERCAHVLVRLPWHRGTTTIQHFGNRSCPAPDYRLHLLTATKARGLDPGQDLHQLRAAPVDTGRATGDLIGRDHVVVRVLPVIATDEGRVEVGINLYIDHRCPSTARKGSHTLTPCGSPDAIVGVVPRPCRPRHDSRHGERVGVVRRREALA